MSEIYIGENENWYINGEDTGKPSRGREGLSAYEIAVSLGYQGTLTDWVNTLKGKEGKSAYELAVDLGYQDTIDDWISSLKGKDGLTPYTGDNGNWFIGNEDTGILADAEKAVEKKIVASTAIKEEGMIMDGKTASEAFNELKSMFLFKTISLGEYCIEPQQYTSISIPYTPPEGYSVVGFTLQLPPRYTAAVRYTGETFNGILFNCTQRSGTYGVNVMLILAKR